MENYYGIIILFVVFFLFMIFTTKKQQKNMLETEARLNKLKIGDKVKTHLGIYGVIVDIYETTDGKIARLNISQNGECLIDLNFKYINGLDEKQVIEYDENMNVISLDGVPVENNITNEETIINNTNQESQSNTIVDKNDNK